jgi:membrane protease YdiL (CAAX protease family)
MRSSSFSIGAVAAGGALVIAGAALAGQSGPDEAAGGGGSALTMLAMAAIALVSLAIAARRGWLAMPIEAPAPAPPPPNPAAVLVTLAVAMPLVGAIGAMAVRRGLGLPDSPDLAGQAWMLGGAALAELPVAIAIIRLLPPGRTGRPVAVFLGVLACAIAFPAVQSIASLAGWIQQLVVGVPPPAVAHRTLESMVADPGSNASLAMLALVVAVIPPLEEIAYRGGLQGGLRRLGFGPWPATLATSVLFAFMHVGAIPETGLAAALSGLFALSIGLGILRERTGSLVAPAVAHALFNLVNVIVARG